MKAGSPIWRFARRYAALALLIGIQIIAAVLVPSRAPDATPPTRSPAVVGDVGSAGP